MPMLRQLLGLILTSSLVTNDLGQQHLSRTRASTHFKSIIYILQMTMAHVVLVFTAITFTECAHAAQQNMLSFHDENMLFFHDVFYNSTPDGRFLCLLERLLGLRFDFNNVIDRMRCFFFIVDEAIVVVNTRRQLLLQRLCPLLILWHHCRVLLTPGG